jgi:hypothetical protein
VACADTLLFLLYGVVSIISVAVKANGSGYPTFPLYVGWTQDHADWTPPQVPYALIASSGATAALSLCVFYINEWIPVVAGFSVFAMFGTTQEARRIYSRPVRFVASALGWHLPSRHQPQLSTIEFTPRSNPSCSMNAEERFVGPRRCNEHASDKLSV